MKSSEGPVFIESESRALAYGPDAERLLHEHPHLIRAVINSLEGLEGFAVGSTFDEGGVKVTLFQRRNWSLNFKVEVGGESYFLRKEQGRGTGFNSMKAYEAAKKIFADDADVGVIDAQFGYTDKAGNDYFAAKWEDLPVLADYLGSDDVEDAEREAIASKLERVYEGLKDFKDVTTYNMFYDKNSGKIVLFDLELRGEGDVADAEDADAGASGDKK